jgi:hypothetical protein
MDRPGTVREIDLRAFLTSPVRVVVPERRRTAVREGRHFDVALRRRWDGRKEGRHFDVALRRRWDGRKEGRHFEVALLKPTATNANIATTGVTKWTRCRVVFPGRKNFPFHVDST